MNTQAAPVKWRYRTVKPKPNSVLLDEHTDHRFGYVVRTDDLTPHNARQEFQARCSCGWKEQDLTYPACLAKRPPAIWHRSKTNARLLGFVPHLREALRQTELDLSCPQCNYGRHICPGCGINVPHGTVACNACEAQQQMVP